MTFCLAVRAVVLPASVDGPGMIVSTRKASGLFPVLRGTLVIFPVVIIFVSHAWLPTEPSEMSPTSTYVALFMVGFYPLPQGCEYPHLLPLLASKLTVS